MNHALDFLAAHWFPTLFLAGALAVLLLLQFLRRRRPGSVMPVALLGGALALLGLGGLLLPPAWAWWLFLAAVVVLFSMAVALVLSGAWWRPLAYAAAGLALLAIGGLWLEGAGQGLAEAGRSLVGIEFVAPWWLLPLLLVPVSLLLSL